jgi:pimeloyl-ACP methyl ester carboxylesterase
MTRRKKLMWSLILVPLAIYLIICTIMFFAQTRMLFPVAHIPAAGPLPAGAERLELAAASGERLRGIHIPPRQPGRERLLILGFGGNGWNAQDMAAMLAALYPQADIVAFHYRGYPPSEGSPGAAGMREDAPLVYDFARARFAGGRVVAIAFSIGNGVAAALAARRPLDGLIMVTAFDSLRRVAAAQFPWLPVRLLFRHNLDPADDLRGTRLPVALLSAGRDGLVQPDRTETLRQALPHLVFDRTLPRADHNSIYRDPGFDPAMREALAKVLAATRQERPSPRA